MDNNFDSLVITWQRAYMNTIKSVSARKLRLTELLTWDTPREDNKMEHKAKVKALQNLLKNYL